MADDQDKKQTPYYRIGSLEKGFKTLELLVTHGALSVSEAANLLGFNRSATHRFIATLKDMGYVVQDRDGKYRPTLRVYSLGQVVADRLESRDEAKRIMTQLNKIFDESVNLGCIEGNELVVIDMIKSQQPLKYDLPIGSRGIAHTTSLGKAILALSDMETVENCWKKSQPLEKKTANTITSQDELYAELKNIKNQGFAIDEEEWVEGIRCIAVAIVDFTGQPVYAISISGPTFRMTKSVLLEMQKHLKEASFKLSTLLGFQ